MTPLLYWLMEIITPLSPDWEWYYEYGTRVQFAIVAIIIIIQTVRSSHRVKAGLYFIALHMIYAVTMDTIFGGVSSLWYLIETAIFGSVALWIALRPEISTHSVNTDNVLLAFYKGERGSLKMHIAEIFGLPVKSLCVIAREKVLRIKNKKFVLDNNAKAIINSDDYLAIDTGTPVTSNILKTMQSYDNVRAKNGHDCISTISPLLYEIAEKYAPGNIFEKLPSVYLRKCLNA